jgi:hypothetical protein
MRGLDSVVEEPDEDEESKSLTKKKETTAALPFSRIGSSIATKQAVPAAAKTSPQFQLGLELVYGECRPGPLSVGTGNDRHDDRAITWFCFGGRGKSIRALNLLLYAEPITRVVVQLTDVGAEEELTVTHDQVELVRRFIYGPHHMRSCIVELKMKKVRDGCYRKCRCKTAPSIASPLSTWSRAPPTRAGIR